jgi:hypothetical protein
MPVDRAMHRQKLRDCFGVRLAPAAIDDVLSGLDRLDLATAREIAALLELLG